MGIHVNLATVLNGYSEKTLELSQGLNDRKLP